MMSYFNSLCRNFLSISKTFCIFVPLFASGCGEMVDTLVSGASASRHVGSSPIIRTDQDRRFFRRSFCFITAFITFVRV